MKISLNWLKKYVKIDLPANELIELIGARLVEVETVTDISHNYDNIYVAKVINCEKIPNTHLSVCKVDVGVEIKKHLPKSKSTSVSEKELGSFRWPFSSEEKGHCVQVVCGAHNVHTGMLAAWLAPGAIVPESLNEDAPFILGTRKLRGYESNGMLASIRELDFSSDHDGIVELDPALATPGQLFTDLYDLRDTIIEVENKPLTRRPDTFGIIGFAREVAGILGQPFIEPDFLANTSTDFTLDSEEKLTIDVADPKLCPRYTALVMSRKKDTKTNYLTLNQTLIARSGMRSIDPIVDATNYLMLLTGQPLHAFDYDKFTAVGGTKSPKVIIRAAKPTETITLLDGREVNCTKNDILITSNNIPVALAGAMGGQNTIIDKDTKKILVESATFSLYHLRKTQMDHGIFSEAITRFTKGQPATGTLSVAKEFATLTATNLKSLAIFDEYPKPAKSTTIKITTQDINRLLGTSYSTDLIKRTLENVGFTVIPEQQFLSVTIPSWRTDISIKEDLIEEIGRLLGFDNIKPLVPLHSTARTNPTFTLKTHLRNTLASHGANEVLTYSFISERLLTSASQDLANSYKITNALSPDLQYVRQQLVPSLIEKIHPNQKDGYKRFALFEINQVYRKDEGLTTEKVPKTFNNLALAITADFYAAKKYLATLDYPFELKSATPTKDKSYFEPKRSAAIFLDGTEIGIIGELKNSTKAAFKLTGPISAFELSLEPLVNLKPSKPALKISDFPSVQRDITLTTTEPFQAIHGAITHILSEKSLIYTVSPVSIYQPNPAAPQNLTFHLEFARPDKTLAATEIDDIMRQLEQIK